MQSFSVSNMHLKAYLHGGWAPQIGGVTCGGSPHLLRKQHDEIKMRDYLDRRGYPTSAGHLTYLGSLSSVYTVTICYQ